MLSYLKYTALAGAFLVIAGLVLSPALQSIGTAIIFLHPFVNKQIKLAYNDLRKNALSLILIAFYILTFISILWTSDYKSFWNQNAILKLPFLLIPIGLSYGGNISKKQFNYLLYFFVGLIWLVATVSFFNYLIHFEEINEQITHSKPIPIISTIKNFSHIYFGVIMAFACCVSFYFSFIEKPANQTLKWIFRSIFFTFLIYIHTITARTGMLAFYASVFVCIIWFMWQARKFLIGFSVLSVVGLILAASLFLIPSLNNRLENTQEDLDHYTQGKEINHYSISMRIESLKTAWKVYKSSPVLGVAPADIKTEMNAQYEADKSPLMQENRKLPHNQFLQTLTTLGIAGLLILIALFLYPFIYRNTYFNFNNGQILFFVFLVICFFSFQVESILERQIGVTFFSLFYILLSPKNIRTNED